MDARREHEDTYWHEADIYLSITRIEKCNCYMITTYPGYCKRINYHVLN